MGKHMSEPRLRRILCVEDDTDIQMILEMALADLGGFDLHLCSDGASARIAVQEQQPDLILLDFLLPDTDGPTLHKEITAKRPDLPIVFITAAGAQHADRRLSGLKTAGLIGKPFNPMTLASQLNDMFNRFHGLAEGGA